MSKRLFFGLFFFLLFILNMQAQDRFLLSEYKQKQSLSFKLINNIVVIPLEINGKELSFILDTGVDKTILFNLQLNDSIELHNIEQIKLYGLGEGEALDALRSTKNRVTIGNIKNIDHMVYVVLDETFDLSAKMGENINGIIGGELFEDFIVDINYRTKKITFYDPISYKSNNLCSKCEIIPLEFIKNKPYVNLKIKDHKETVKQVKLLIDSGGSDALWLFANDEKDISVPDNYFKDFLGKGLSGNIYGKRSRIKELIIGDYIIENPSTSFPDSSSVFTAMQNEQRNGTLGAEVLRRFRVIFDYSNQQLSIRPNKGFSDPFLYNKSGMELVHGGDVLVKESKAQFIGPENIKNQSSFSEISYAFGLSFKPSYQISYLRPESPALEAGLQVGDIILEINGKPAYDQKLHEIILTLSKQEGQKINVLVDRGGRQIKYKFKLKGML
ncbi:aspartyl protease family protein [Namhaeicola litoreus]|uniref:Aspartyl protease family protein n=1 Tax=Namhaeicola litoreus TaxID=1052145 RepID=A0ABW3Y8M2_9FLAO